MEAQELSRLPSLPQVLIDLLEALRGDGADSSVLADIVHRDAAVCARLISVANSSFYGRSRHCETVERAIHTLGSDVFKTVVITASIQQFYAQLGEQHQRFLAAFWRRSLLLAHIARRLAELTRYPLVEEAYLAALLADVGRIVLLVRAGERYLALHDSAASGSALLAGERALLGQDHVQLSAAVIKHAGLGATIAAAVATQHAAAESLQEASPLSQLLGTAVQLVEGDKPSYAALDLGARLFGLHESMLQVLRRHGEQEVGGLAASLGISIGQQEASEWPAQAEQRAQRLAARLQEADNAVSISVALGQARRVVGLRDAIGRSLQLTLGIDRSALFLLDEGSHLVAVLPGQDSLQVLPLRLGDSVVANALIERAPRIAGQDMLSNAVEQAIVAALGVSAFLAWPLLVDEQAVGVLLIASPEWVQQRVLDAPGPLAVVCNGVAQRVAAHRDIPPPAPAADTGQIVQRVAAEVSRSADPTDIVQRYLAQLRDNLPAAAGEQRTILAAEIERVGHVLLQLQGLQAPALAEHLTDVNAVIAAVVDIFNDSMFLTRHIDARMTLGEALPAADLNAIALRQIVSNLLDFAADRLPQGGEIAVVTARVDSVDGVQIELCIGDSGPALATETQRLLLAADASKDASAALPVGLRIARQLVSDLQGTLSYDDIDVAANLSQFRILLPVGRDSA